MDVNDPSSLDKIVEVLTTSDLRALLVFLDEATEIQVILAQQGREH